MNHQNLPASILLGRAHYRSSCDIHFTSFLTWLGLALGGAVMLAAAMYWLYHVGHYYLLIVPLLTALAVGGLARLAVNKGHCRNRWVGWITGGLLGIVLYLGSYYIGMVHLLGSQVAGHPQVLAQYIRFRLTTDRVRDSHRGADGEEVAPRRADVAINWFSFGLECLASLGIVATAAGRRAGKPYCESCHRWMERELTPFDPAQTNHLIECLENGNLRGLASLVQETPFATIPNLTMALDFCPTLKESGRGDCPAFLSLKWVKAPPQGASLDAFDQAKGKVLVRTIELLGDELQTLAARFPVLGSLGGITSSSARLTPPESKIAPAAHRAGPQSLAEIIPLAPEIAGRIFTRAMMWKGTLMSAAGLVGIFGGLGLLTWGATRLEEYAGDVVGISLCVVGGAAVLFAIGGIFLDSSFGGNRMLRKAFLAEVGRRPDAWVRADDPAARFVEVVPKLNWGKTMLDNASDIGLLRVDADRREIRFEGDRERWRIPVTALTHCAVEHYVHGQGTGAIKMFYVVLRAAHPGGFWEAPVRPREAVGLASGRRRKQACKLHAEIQALIE
jgi:hypothetical protein